MTLEEAKIILINRGFVEINGDLVFDGNKWRNAITVISKWLEQQPCEDCISRQAVLETIEDCNSDGLKGIFCSYNDGKRFEEYIKELPSVTPKEKIGLCKDCKWWKDNDGVYRRGIGAESKCPINCKKVYDGNGYCFMFE